MMPSFSKETLELLHRAGWTESREFDTTKYEQLLKGAGYPVHKAVTTFLRDFGGLHIAYQIGPAYVSPTHPSLRKRDILHFDVELAIAHTFLQNVYGASQWLGQSLCVIGEFEGNDATLMMDEAGRVYTDFDDPESLVLVGNSGLEAIENVCRGRDFRKVSRNSE
jgi:hypothetical protein